LVFARTSGGRYKKGGVDAKRSYSRIPQLSDQSADADGLARPVRDELTARGYHAVIIMDEPLLRGTFDPESKVMAYIEASDAFVAFCTDDIRNPGRTAQNIIDEIGRARAHPKLRDVVCVLKAASVTLPTNINPTWARLSPGQPDAALDVILAQLEAWDVMPAIASPAVVPRATLPPGLIDNLVAGVDLGAHDVAERRLLDLLAHTQKRFHDQIVSSLFERTMSAEDDTTNIHVLSSFLEAAARLDPNLVRGEWISALSESPIIEHRICAAPLLWDHAEAMPGDVSLDVLASLAKPATEDWYVFAPAMAAAKQLVLSRKSAMGIFEALAKSGDAEDRQSAAFALVEIAAIKPEVVPEKLAKQLAADGDAEVAEQGRRLVDGIAGVTDHERRWAYGKFGLGGSAVSDAPDDGQAGD
jgi:hypothetical protein